MNDNIIAIMIASKVLSNEYKKRIVKYFIKKCYLATTKTLLINDPGSEKKKNLRQLFYPGLCS